MDDKLISKLDAADMLGVSVSTVERLISDGDLPMYKIRGQCRLMTSDIKTYIAGCRRVAAKGSPRPRAQAARPTRLEARRLRVLPGDESGITGALRLKFRQGG